MRTCAECRYAEWNPDPFEDEIPGRCKAVPHYAPPITPESPECFFFKVPREEEGLDLVPPGEEEGSPAEEDVGEEGDSDTADQEALWARTWADE